MLKVALTGEEGNRTVAYLDSQQHLTVGVGHLVVASDHIVLGQQIPMT
jgi:GH24 family phage-related lysozyme (muramidase)